MSSTAPVRHHPRTAPERDRPQRSVGGRHLHLGAGLGRPAPRARDPYQPRRERRRRGDALAAALARAGARTTVVTDHRGDATTGPAVRVVRVGSARRGGLPVAEVAARTLTLGRSSVLHLHVDGLEDLLALSTAGLAHRGSVVLHVHGSPGTPLRSGETAGVTSRVLGAPLEARLVRCADLVVVGSDRLAAQVTEAGARRVAVVPPAPLAPPSDLPATGSGCEPARPADTGRRLVSIGALTARRRPTLLVDALAVLPDDVELVLVGNGPERSAIVRTARSHGVGDRVHVVPTASWATVNALITGADVVTSAALVGEDPGAVLLAMAAERPVVATAVEGIPHVLAADVDGWLVPPLAPHALPDALGEALADPVTAATRAGSARRRVTARGWDGVAAEVLAALG